MKNTMLRSLSLLGISLMLTLSVAAQNDAKVKTTDKENKYKSEDIKIKDKKDETKYKADEVKVKDKKDEEKYKSDDLKIKDKKGETKIKGTVKPMRATSTTRTEMKTGETQVKTREHIEPIDAAPPVPEPAVTSEVAVPQPSIPVKDVSAHKYAAKKSTAHRRTAARKTTTARKYIVRTKIVRDTVLVPSPPEKVVSVQKEYVHDTVSVTRVDTVVKKETQNTYTGYNVPKGNFKKVKLKKEDDGSVHMKKK